MGVGGHCKVRDVHIRKLVERYRRMLGELKYRTRREPTSPGSEQLRIGCAALAQAVPSIHRGADLESIAPVRFSPQRPFSSAQLTREILAALRREKIPQSESSLASALLLHNRMSMGTLSKVRFRAK